LCILQRGKSKKTKKHGAEKKAEDPSVALKGGGKNMELSMERK